VDEILESGHLGSHISIPRASGRFSDLMLLFRFGICVIPNCMEIYSVEASLLLKSYEYLSRGANKFLHVPSQSTLILMRNCDGNAGTLRSVRRE
jgi:hypothetical protein